MVGSSWNNKTPDSRHKTRDGGGGERPTSNIERRTSKGRERKHGQDGHATDGRVRVSAPARHSREVGKNLTGGGFGVRQGVFKKEGEVIRA